MDKVACHQCAATILVFTAERTGGRCMPCFQSQTGRKLGHRGRTKPASKHYGYGMAYLIHYWPRALVVITALLMALGWIWHLNRDVSTDIGICRTHCAEQGDQFVLIPPGRQTL